MARAQASRAVQARIREKAGRRYLRVDHATVLGLVSGFGLLFAAMAVGGRPGSFADLPSLLIVVGGTLGVTTMCYSLRDMARMPLVIARTFMHAPCDPREAAREMLKLADLVRRKGLLELDRSGDSLGGNPFVRNALRMAVDGVPVNEIHAALERDIDEMIRRHVSSSAILRKAADIAPAMGLIGTLIGLVQMLGNLEDPSAIGPGMAIALLTTFYGAVLSTMVFSPLASKLERNSAEEALVANVHLLGAQSICRKENPRRLEIMLNTVLPPDKRVQFFD